MRKLSLIALLGISAGLGSCTYQKNNTIEQDDVNEGNEYVYGVHKDSTAKQLKQSYTAKPELADRTAKIKEIMYGPEEASNAAETGTAAPAPADSTKK
jgi:hypothetical protein